MKYWVCLTLLASALSARGQNVVVNEIMYHPASENPREEYIELWNRGATSVNLTGWQLSGGVDYRFPSNTTINAGAYLVVSAHKASFLAKYTAVPSARVVGDWAVLRTTNAVGITITNWENTLSNTRNTINLRNATNVLVGTVTYADEGDWAIRQRGFDHFGRRGWIWNKAHDGFGKSLELINADLPNDLGQNWAASVATEGTPGFANSVQSANVAPLLLDVQHRPSVPRASDPITITCRVLNETMSGLTVRLQWRADAPTPPLFSTNVMFDDGLHGDGLSGDGLYGAVIPLQANNTVIEYFVSARDAEGNARNWPAPAIDADDAPQPRAPLGQVANALFQVDDDPANQFGGTPSMQPVYKMILTENERAELAAIPCSGAQNSDAQMNVTFISMDAQGTEVRYLCGVRNRGHASRCANPPNYRMNFRSDQPWKDVIGMNLNARQVHIQHFGSVLANKSGAAGTYCRPVQVRVNNQNRAQSGSPMFGSYAALEAYNSDWPERHFPSDSGGNIYRAIRDADPNYDYQGENPFTYQDNFFKETNVSEDNWRDLIAMLSVIGVSGPVPFTTENVREIVNVEQWMTHLAVMNLIGNNESGLNTGNNDDYFMYRGVNDPRFILMFHDLDQIIGQGGSLQVDASIFTATSHPALNGEVGGVGPEFNRLMHWPDFEPIYYATLQRLLDTTFSQVQFNALIDQTLGGYVTPNTINAMKNWMTQRRAYVQGVIAPFVPAPVIPPVATITGEPRSPTPSRNATLAVGGPGITHYSYRLNNGAFSVEAPVATPISLSNLPNNSTNVVSAIGRNASGIYQDSDNPTRSRAWVVNTSWPTVRLNEILARNESAVNHSGTFPDLIELFNEGAGPVDLSGMRLTDDASDPDKFVFPPNTSLAAGTHLTLYANDPDGTSGLHLGFNLAQDGDGVYLFHRAADGGALLDSVEFGLQLPNLSIGRFGAAGGWLLAQPTFPGANTAQPLGNESNLRINEWLAAGQSPFADDFIELFNPNPTPVALGGLYLTDTPIGWPNQHRIPDLSFVAAGGFTTFIADGNDGSPDRVAFGLDSDQGEIALYSSSLALIDCVSYGPRRVGVAEGRCPDGAPTMKLLVVPTPGGGNACPIPPPPPGVTFLSYTNIWKYNDTGANLGTAWIPPDADDEAWPQGPGVLGRVRGGGTVPEPVRTTLTISNTRTTFYFRTHFNLPANHGFNVIQLTHLIDDGAVFYLNGLQLFPYNMPGGPITSTTLAAGNILDPDYVGPISIPLSNFLPGDNVLAVEVHQAAATSGDIIFGLTLVGVTADPGGAGIVINEILANNATQTEPDGSTPDWVELYNPSANPVDLGGMSLSDATGNRWFFPSSSILPGMGRFRVRFDADRPASTTNTGFGLKASGDIVTLYNKAPNTNTPVDSRAFGLQAADFSIGRVPEGGPSWQLTLPTIGTANIAATLGNVSQLKMNEWLADPQPGEDDWFEIYNPNPQPVDVSFCYLNDSSTTHRLPALCFIGAITNAWQTFIADNNAGAGADHVPFRLGASSDSIGLANSNGVPVDSITFTAQVADVSEGRLPDGTTAILKFPGTKSPGEANFVALTNMVINEVLTHTDLPREDAIELFNPTASAVNVGGWWLSDSRAVPQKFQIPANTPSVPPGGFLVFYENQFNNRDTAMLPFALSSAEGDEVYLSAGNTNGVMNGYRTFADFGPAANGVSFGRYRTSVGFDFPSMSQHTFGVDTPANVAQFRTGTGKTNAYPKVGSIIISEIMYHPPDIIVPGVSTNDNAVEEFVELRNTSASTVALYDPAYPTNGWRLRDAVDFRFNSLHSIPAGGHVIVVGFDPQTNLTALAQFRARYGSNLFLVGPFSGKLDNSGESVELVRPDTPQTNGFVPSILVEKVVYQDRGFWPTNADGFGMSLQRVSSTGYANDPTNWVAAAPSPGPFGVMDTDGDGMPDDWEDLYNFNKTSAADAGQDADGDGLSNLEEYLAGTHPRQAGSSLRLTATMNGTTTELRFSAVAGRTYTILYSDSLPGVPAWQRLADVPAQGSTQTVMVPDSSAGPGMQRFYRIVTPAAP